MAKLLLDSSAERSLSASVRPGPPSKEAAEPTGPENEDQQRLWATRSANANAKSLAALDAKGASPVLRCLVPSSMQQTGFHPAHQPHRDQGKLGGGGGVQELAWRRKLRLGE